MNIRFPVFIGATLLVLAVPSPAQEPTVPRLTNNPSWDVTVTNSRPLLSILNAEGGVGPRSYVYQVSPDAEFPAASTIEYSGIPETNRFITEKRIEEGDELADGVTWWRARAVDALGNPGPWAEAIRFRVDTVTSRTFMNLTRAQVVDVRVSSGADQKNVVDWTDQGQATWWNSAPLSGDPEWVVLDMGRMTRINRIWMLSTRHSREGWLRAFVWQSCDEAACREDPGGVEGWRDIPETRTVDNDTYRNILDFAPVAARTLRLRIDAWQGLLAQINEIIPYSPGMPAVPETPNRDYVLLIGNQMDGFTATAVKKELEEDHVGDAQLVRDVCQGDDGGRKSAAGCSI